MTDIVWSLRNDVPCNGDIGCAQELCEKAAAEIERLLAKNAQNLIDLNEYRLDVERLRTALEKISTWPDHRLPSPREIARAALEGKHD